MSSHRRSTVTSFPETPDGSRHDHPPVWPVVLGGVATATVCWWLLSSVADLVMVVDISGTDQRVGIISVVVTALVASLGAIAVAWQLRRRAKRPRRMFLVVAITVFALSLLGPLGSADSVDAGLALALLHLSVAAVVIPMIATRLPTRSA